MQHVLCEECARGQPAEHPQESFKVIQFFGQILQQSGELSQTTEEGLTCPGCQMTLDRFHQGNRLGCPRCYETFQNELETIFLRVQEQAVHCGKVPGRPRTTPPMPIELRRLKENLARAVEEERFEDAALYRDQIRKLGDELDESSTE